LKADVHVLKATEADVPVILKMIRGLAEYEKLSDQVTATEEKLRTTLFGEHPAAYAVLAWLEGNCVGFALFFSTYSTFLAKPGLFLEDLYVEPGHRGKGIGRALLGRVADIAEERDCGRLEWDVLGWNQPAIGFYERLGAKPMDQWTKYRLTGEALRKLAAGANGGMQDPSN
jgi:GNAT superfamily N-acetyltransferase